MDPLNTDPMPELDASMKAHAAGDEAAAQSHWALFVRHLFTKMVKAGAAVEWSKTS